MEVDAQLPQAEAVWTTLRELRMAGVASDAVPVDAFESPAKHAEIVALLSAYEAHLEALGRGDMASVYEEALAHPDWCPIQPQDCWTELPHTLWTPLQRRLLSAMPGERLQPRVLALPNVVVPRRLKTAPADFAEPDAAASPLAFLMALALVAIRNVQWNGYRVRVGSGAGLLPESQFEREFEELRQKRDQVKALFGIESEAWATSKAHRV